MGLRCSLLGHDYGETTTERDREEKGGEVIVEERELQVCARCGTEKVLSENTEVRTLSATPQEESPETTAPEPETSEPSFSEPTDTTADSTVGGGESTPTASTPAEHAPDADEDDAVILEDDPDQERDTGQWPDEAQQEAMTETAETGEPEPEPAPWPDQSGEDEGFDAKPATESSDEDGAAVDFGGGLTPESADPGETVDAGDEGFVEAPSDSPPEGQGKPSKFDSTGGSSDAGAPSSASDNQGEAQSQSASQPGEAEDEVVDAGFTSAGPVNPPTGSTDDADTLLVCPECGFERKAARASLRAGDICPECRKGYLAERR